MMKLIEDCDIKKKVYSPKICFLSDDMKLTSGRNQGKDQFPGQRQEVHDVVSA